MYVFVSKENQNQLAKACEEIIIAVQKRVKDYFSFEFKLVGSGERKLITQNGADGSFDLDYNFILHKDKQDLFSYPDKIKDVFLRAFNEINPTYKFKCPNNSTSVITSRLILNDKLAFSFDVAILAEGNNGNFFKLVFDKTTGSYLWNEIPQTKDYFRRYQMIKETGHFEQFRQRYLELKNIHLSRNDGIKSFSIFLETLNEFRII